MFVERPRLARGKAGDVLRAAVVRQQAAQPQVAAAVSIDWASASAPRRRDAAARADRDVDDDIGGQPGCLGRVRQVARVPASSTAWMKSGSCLLQRHRAPDLARRRVARRHADAVDALRHQRLGLAHLGGADAERAGGQLQLGDGRALVRLGVRAGRQGRIRVSRACIVAMFDSSASRSTHSAGVSRSHFEIPTPLATARAVLGGGVAGGARRNPDVRGGGGGGADERAASEGRGHRARHRVPPVVSTSWLGSGAAGALRAARGAGDLRARAGAFVSRSVRRSAALAADIRRVG